MGMVRKLPKDEICTCGHLKSQHSPSEYPIGTKRMFGEGLDILQVGGHGKCNLCDCQKFTWKGFVF